MAADKLIGRIKERAGAVVGDPGLELEGSLQQEKAEQRTAAEMDAVRREEAEASAAHEQAIAAARAAEKAADQAEQTAAVLDGTRQLMEA
jgi:uncharacterized protein YjbJ (UPF0337 family)